MQRRSDIAEHCFNFIAWLDRNANQIVERLLSDNAAKVLGLQKDFNKVWIQIIASSVYTEQASGLADGINRIMLNKVRAMLSKADMNKLFRTSHCGRQFISTTRQSLLSST